MKNRLKMLTICVISLIIGLIIYIFLRPEAYISEITRTVLKIKLQPEKSLVPASFYLPDFLWSLSLCCGLYAIYPLKRYTWLWGAITFLYGCLWELMQVLCVVSGTADTIDIFLYLTAAVTVVIINYFLNKEKKK